MTDNQLLVSVGYATPGEIIRRQIDRHAVALQDADVVLPHLPAHVGQDVVSIFEFYAERRVGKDFGDGPHHLDRVTCHNYSRS